MLNEQRFPVRLLARDEWGGVADMVQLLPAFAMPNDPAVARILRTAAERLASNGLAVGKTVLFVAEKTAALDVVYRRLREHGLGDHCVELHSNKADRRHFLAQLKSAWENGGRDEASEWVAVNDRLKLRRDVLNAYVAALHRRHPNGWTAYLALGTALRATDMRNAARLPCPHRT